MARGQLALPEGWSRDGLLWSYEDGEVSRAVERTKNPETGLIEWCARIQRGDETQYEFTGQDFHSALGLAQGSEVTPRETGTRPAPQPKPTPKREKEAPVAKAQKIELGISGRVGRCVDMDIPGLEVEEIARGRGTRLKLTGTKTSLKKLRAACEEAFEDRKGKEPDEYEDRYQAGEAVKVIDEALA